MNRPFLGVFIGILFLFQAQDVFAAQDILLSEIMACPETGESEWVEFYNPTDSEVVLANWAVQDDRATTKLFSITIPPDSYAVATWSTSLLNNSGDVLSILDGEKNIIFSEELPACNKGMSWIYTAQGFVAAVPSPEQENPQTQVSPSPSTKQATLGILETKSPPTPSPPATPSGESGTTENELLQAPVSTIPQLPPETLNKSFVPDDYLSSLNLSAEDNSQQSEPAATLTDKDPPLTFLDSPLPYIIGILGGAVLATSGTILLYWWWQQLSPGIKLYTEASKLQKYHQDILNQTQLKLNDHAPP